MSAVDTEALLAQALLHHRSGDAASADRLYRAVLDSDTGSADAWRLWGCLARSAGDLEEAERRILRSIELRDDDAEAWASLGHVRLERHDDLAALAAFERALGLRPDHREATYGLGNACARAGLLDEARALLARVCAEDPQHHRARHDLATTLNALGERKAALATLDSVVAAAPDLAEARYNRALVRLALGDYGGGFADLERRWDVRAFPSPRRHQDVPSWSGDRLEGRRLVVHAEQGLGDTLQFVRFVPQLTVLGGDVTLEVARSLLRVLAAVPGIGRLRAFDDPPEPFDLQLPMMSLGHRLHLTLGSVEASKPYLTAEHDLRERWAGRLGPGPFVAVAWRGNPRSPVDRGRSLADPSPLAPLAELPGCRLVAVQKLDASDLVPHAGPTGWRVAHDTVTIEHPGPDLDGGADAFVDTLAIVELAAAVVTTDTALAHLAGAAGARTHLLLQRAPDWRWLEERSDSPWYPTMTLHRQIRRGDWSAPVRTCADALARDLAAPMPRGSSANTDGG